MNSSLPTKEACGPKKPKMPSQSQKITEVPGDHERLNFQKNIVENIVGVELDELSDEDEKAESKLKNIEKEVANPIEMTAPPAQAAVGTQIIPPINPPGRTPETPEPNTEQPVANQNQELNPQNAPENLVAEIQASIQEEKAQQAESFVLYMLALGIQFGLLFMVSAFLAMTQQGQVAALEYSLIAALVIDTIIKTLYAIKLKKQKDTNTKRNKIKIVVEMISALKDITIGVFIVIKDLFRP